MPSSATLGLALFTAAVAAQSGVQLITAVGLATQCLPYTAQPTFPPAPVVINNGNTINVNIVAPSCNVCGCQGDGCTAINVYQTTYQNFNSIGSLTQQVYVVTATYPGVSPTGAPSVVSLPCPLGFTTTVQTCTAGPTPTSALLTVPVTTCPFVTGLSAPSTVPAGVSVSSYAFCPTVPAAAATTAPAAPVAPVVVPAVSAPPAAPAVPVAPAAPGAASAVPAVPAAPAAPAAAGAASAVPAVPAAPAAPAAAGAASAVPAAPAAPAAAAGGSASGSSAAGAAPAAPAAPAGGSVSSAAAVGVSPAATVPGSSPAAVTPVAPASTTYVKSAATRPVVSVVVGCAFGLVLSLAATL
ncbi:hypothetical protein N0V93_006821 [Gnomoniopsis smithogilvyi]|uniref:Uncharacterized protein n=1 Tax=Gnomoniopsis smithogilvyi TaxID=1191159 RepID=A0A9W8YQ44_9PEZI|nr:hypothetical protein N0V93_006821 [Gnomoniopsis smithogilvyi]